MKHLVKIILMVTLLIFMVGCGDDLNQPSKERVKGGELLVDFSASAMKASLLKEGLVQTDTTVYGYKSYKIPYTTQDEEGNSVNASGSFIVPVGLPDIVYSTLGLSMVSDDHGTIFSNKEAPSFIADQTGAPHGSAVLLTALGGFATLQPDYIGFGDSNSHYHPFLLKDSLANSTVDFIKQVKVFASENNITLNSNLFLTGYSEGGYAAMATLKKIEEENTGLTVTLAAPMAGPYALKTTADGVLSSSSLGVPAFMADIAYAYATAKNQSMTAILNEPYASRVEGLFSDDLTDAEIDANLTKTTTGSTGLFSQSFVSDYFTNTSNWFKVAVTENNLHDWAPATTVKLVQCQGDEVIPYVIAQFTEGNMTQAGSSSVSLVPVEATLGLTTHLKHVACGTPAYKVTTSIFAQTRKATIGY